jgi:hypothetical protein
MDCKLSFAAHFPKQHEARSPRTRDRATKESAIRPTQKPGFSGIFCLPTEIWVRNPVSHPHTIRPPKKARSGPSQKPGFSDIAVAKVVKA